MAIASSPSSGDLPGKDAPWHHVGFADHHAPGDPSSLGALEPEASTGAQWSCNPILLFTENPHEQKPPRGGLMVAVSGPEQAGSIPEKKQHY